MPDITISTGSNSEEKKQPEIKEVIAAAVEVEKIERENERMKKAIIEREELRAKLASGGRANAGQYTPEKTKEEAAKEEAAKLLKAYL